MTDCQRLKQRNRSYEQELNLRQPCGDTQKATHSSPTMTRVYDNEEALADALNLMVPAGQHGWSTAKLAQRINEASREANQEDSTRLSMVTAKDTVPRLVLKMLARIAMSDTFYAAFSRLSGFKIKGLNVPGEQEEAAPKRDRDADEDAPSPRQGKERKRQKKNVPVCILLHIPILTVICHRLNQAATHS